MEIKMTKRYSRKEAAAIIGKSEKTLDRYTSAGIITAHLSTVNGKRWWKGADLAKLAEGLV